MNRKPNPNKYVADIIENAASIASGRGKLALANALWGFEAELREEGKAILAESGEFYE